MKATVEFDNAGSMNAEGDEEAVRKLYEMYMSHNTRPAAKVDVATGETSDGYHTFNELYEHRHALFIALAKAYPDKAWKSWEHDDGSLYEGWFIAGIKTPEGQATYHLPARLWDDFKGEFLHRAPKWDGHTPDDVIKRIALLTKSGR